MGNTSAELVQHDEGVSRAQTEDSLSIAAVDAAIDSLRVPTAVESQAGALPGWPQTR
jgi:hypothetical protein